ncbi:hypothetical protein VTK73DRAFT_7286 [Phialemonium thermophilum]|uniref:Uncharacterized protein n=1 Tax=Phialemonium thermophilum TaxID=223376 RepID=A0ABR3WFE3_9PEZI
MSREGPSAARTSPAAPHPRPQATQGRFRRGHPAGHGLASTRVIRGDDADDASPTNLPILVVSPRSYSQRRDLQVYPRRSWQSQSRSHLHADRSHALPGCSLGALLKRKQQMQLGPSAISRRPLLLALSWSAACVVGGCKTGASKPGAAVQCDLDLPLHPLLQVSLRDAASPVRETLELHSAQCVMHIRGSLLAPLYGKYQVHGIRGREGCKSLGEGLYGDVTVELPSWTVAFP